MTILIGMSGVNQVVASPQSPDTLSLRIAPAVACDSPLVNVMIRLGEVPLTVRKFRVGMKYYNGSFYFNGNLTPNPAFDSLYIDYMPGGATDWLTIERTDTTPVTITEPWLFSFQANYFGGNHEINIDTFDLSPSQSYVEDSSGQLYSLSTNDGWVYAPVASCVIEPTVMMFSDTVSVPVLVHDMPPLEYFSFLVRYPADKVQLLEVTDLNPALVPFVNFTYVDSGAMLRCSWHSGMPLAFIGDGVLCKLKFLCLPPFFPGIIPLSFHPFSDHYFLGPDTAAQVYIPTCFEDGFISIQSGIPDNVTESNLLHIYPNPSPDGHYRLLVPQGEKVVHWNIYHCNGSLVRSERIVNTAQINEFNIDASDLPGGIYFVSVITEMAEYRGKLVK
jgi:hypothetical protein